MSKGFVVVTGGTKGIGKAVIERFAKEGREIVACARNLADLEQLQKEMKSAHQVAVHIFQADLSRQEETKAFGDFVRTVGTPAVLVNNAGRFIPGLVHEEEEGALQDMIETNLYSAYHLSRNLIPSMKEEGVGHIFNICSVASIMAYPNGGSYSISKFALYGFSKALREELKPHGIRVTSLLPGATLTASWEGVDLPQDRLMKSEDIAEMIYASFTLSSRSVVEDIIIRPQLGDL